MIDVTTLRGIAAQPKEPQKTASRLLILAEQVREEKWQNGNPTISIFQYHLNCSAEQLEVIQQALAGNLPPEGTEYTRKVEPASQGFGGPVVVGSRRVPWSPNRDYSNRWQFRSACEFAKTAGLKLPERDDNGANEPQPVEPTPVATITPKF